MKPELFCKGLAYEPHELLPSGVLAANAVTAYAIKRKDSRWRVNLCSRYLERWTRGPQIEPIDAGFYDSKDWRPQGFKLPQDLIEFLERQPGSKANALRRILRQQKTRSSAPSAFSEYSIGFPVGPNSAQSSYYILTRHKEPLFTARLYRGDQVPEAWKEHRETMRLDKGWWVTHFHWQDKEDLDPMTREKLYGSISRAVRRFIAQHASHQKKHDPPEPWREIKEKEERERARQEYIRQEQVKRAANARAAKIRKEKRRKQKKAEGKSLRPRPAKRAPKKKTV